MGAVHVQLSQVNALQCQILGQTFLLLPPFLTARHDNGGLPDEDDRESNNDGVDKRSPQFI